MTATAAQYASGEDVRLGDVVGIGEMFFGKIVCLVESGERCDDFPADQWTEHERGFVVQMPDGATMMCDAPEEMTLLDRA